MDLPTRPGGSVLRREGDRVGCETPNSRRDGHVVLAVAVVLLLAGLLALVEEGIRGTSDLVVLFSVAVVVLPVLSIGVWLSLRSPRSWVLDLREGVLWRTHWRTGEPCDGRPTRELWLCVTISPPGEGTDRGGGFGFEAVGPGPDPADSDFRVALWEESDAEQRSRLVEAYHELVRAVPWKGVSGATELVHERPREFDHAA